MAIRELALDPDEVGILRVGAPAARFKPDLSMRNRKREELGVSEDDIVAIYVGSVVPHKRLKDLVEAFARLARHRHNARLLIVGGGDPDYIAEVRNLACSRQIEDQVVITARYVDKEELIGCFVAADLGVWPGGYSVATLEGMAAGLPIVVIAGNPYTEFLTSRNNGGVEIYPPPTSQHPYKP